MWPPALQDTQFSFLEEIRAELLLECIGLGRGFQEEKGGGSRDCQEEEQSEPSLGLEWGGQIGQPRPEWETVSLPWILSSLCVAQVLALHYSLKLVSYKQALSWLHLFLSIFWGSTGDLLVDYFPGGA